jgi:FAD/FMN-containing dehydrogenase
MPPRTPPDFKIAAAAAAAEIRSIPADQPVRLKKQTSNLFRSREQASHCLNLAAFDGVYSVDPLARTAVVGGLTTYEDLVAATLPHGLVPLCVPQLRTITLGGAVTGMGIEAASFRNGVPHESVLAMDILLGNGQVVHATPDGPDAELYSGFANSYGSLGYALRLVIELEPIKAYVALRHVPFTEVQPLTAAMRKITETGQWQGEAVDYMDGTVFSPTEMYLTLGRYDDEALTAPSDYRGQQIYYLSIQEKRTDLLTTLDYLWRWDTDWFWCSRALGAQNPHIRRLWPKQWLRSDVYWKIIALDRKLGWPSSLSSFTRRWAYPQSGFVP